MRVRTRWPLKGQMGLFSPPAPLRWSDLPAEARERTTLLLARLLRRHLRAYRAKGVRHE
jgi:hypothetical protein